jgi:hypothetical protein
VRVGWRRPRGEYGSDEVGVVQAGGLAVCLWRVGRAVDTECQPAQRAQGMSFTNRGVEASSSRPSVCKTGLCILPSGAVHTSTTSWTPMLTQTLITPTPSPHRGHHLGGARGGGGGPVGRAVPRAGGRGGAARAGAPSRRPAQHAAHGRGRSGGVRAAGRGGGVGGGRVWGGEGCGSKQQGAKGDQAGCVLQVRVEGGRV